MTITCFCGETFTRYDVGDDGETTHDGTYAVMRCETPMDFPSIWYSDAFQYRCANQHVIFVEDQAVDAMEKQRG